jgi:peptidyl-prolyl cis-trans isomerase SurA
MQFRPILVCLGLAISVSAADNAVSAADNAVVEEIVVKVNGDIITRSELDRDRMQMEAELKARGATAIEQTLTERGKDILRERIDRMLLVQKGKELSINVDTEVSKAMAELQLQSKIVDTEKFQAFVREQTGMPFEDYKSEMRNQFMTQRVVREQVGRGINIPRAELQQYYDQHKNEFVREERVFLREIFVSTEGKDEAAVAAAEKKAKDLAARARKGERFGELARQNSDSVTKEQNGELGGFKKSELDREIADLVFAQERGFVSDPIRRSNGFLIVRVDDKHKAGQAELEEVENEIMERLYMPRFQPRIREYLTELRKDAFLEIKPGYVDTGAAPGKNTAWTDPAQLKPETVTKEEVANQRRRRRLFWAIPIPGTSTGGKTQPGTSSSSQ